MCHLRKLLLVYFLVLSLFSKKNWSLTLTDISKGRNVFLSPTLLLVAEKASSLPRLCQVQRSLLYSEIKLDFLTVSHERAAK